MTKHRHGDKIVKIGNLQKIEKYSCLYDYTQKSYINDWAKLVARDAKIMSGMFSIQFLLLNFYIL